MVGTHTKSVDDEVTDGDRALAFEVGRSSSSGSQCGCEGEARWRLLDCDHALARVDHLRQGVGSIVVLPEPVPPEMTMFMRDRAGDLQVSSPSSRTFRAEALHHVERVNPGFSEKLPNEMAVPRSDSGGMMTLTRLPSWRRASQSGLVWSIRRPTLFTIRCAIWK